MLRTGNRNHRITETTDVLVEAITHRDEQQSLLLLCVTAKETEAPERIEGARVATIIDRSGSMSGPKLETTKEAAALLIRSLSKEDRIGVVAYDDEAEIISSLAIPNAGLADSIGAIRAGGCTNLYEGWLAGAKMAGRGGRAILLSDGLANRGRYRRVNELGEQARISRERFGVTTSTIGIGTGYDEGVMGEMARLGGGSHYYARSTEDVIRAFSQERFAIGALALESATVEFSGGSRPLGQLLSGETKKTVLHVYNLGESFRLSLLSRRTGRQTTVAIQIPSGWGKSDEATLELLLEEAANLQSEGRGVWDSRAAGDIAQRIRSLLLRLLTHPLSDTPLADAVRGRLEATKESLEQLAHEYDESAATATRKMMVQIGHCLRQRSMSFSVCEEDRRLGAVLRWSSSSDVGKGLDRSLLNLAALADWRRWNVVPVSQRGRSLTVMAEDPMDGFRFAEIEKALGLKVRAVQASGSEIAEALAESFKKEQGAT